MDMIYKYRKFERQRTLFVDSSQEKKHREKQRKRLAFFLSRHVNWTFQRLLSTVGLRRQPNRARNAPATVLATSSVISGMPRRINSVKCSKVSFQVLPTSQCNKNEKLTIIAIQHVFGSVACFPGASQSQTTAKNSPTLTAQKYSRKRWNANRGNL